MYQTDLTASAHSPGFQAPGEGGVAPPHTCHTCGHGGGRPSSSTRRALWWGIAGTLLSGVGWIALMLFDQYNASLAELRNDLKHFHEARAELVTKERMRKLYDQFKDFFKELQASTTAREALQQQLKDSERSRRVMARELQRIRERLANVEGRQAATTVAVPLGGTER
jgi:septal ring factor EnvC (AmiA/AmiB activator)